MTDFDEQEKSKNELKKNSMYLKYINIIVFHKNKALLLRCLDSADKPFKVFKESTREQSPFFLSILHTTQFKTCS
jgi:hypothetical protein